MKTPTTGHAVRRHGAKRLPLFDPKPGLPPGGREACCAGQRPCPYVRCKWHLWLVLGEDRPGRPHNGKHPPTTLAPRWLESPMPPSCALDVADAVKDGREFTIDQLAEMLGMHHARLFEILATAIAKLKLSRETLREFTEDDRQTGAVAR